MPTESQDWGNEKLGPISAMSAGPGGRVMVAFAKGRIEKYTCFGRQEEMISKRARPLPVASHASAVASYASAVARKVPVEAPGICHRAGWQFCKRLASSAVTHSTLHPYTTPQSSKQVWLVGLYGMKPSKVRFCRRV